MLVQGLAAEESRLLIVRNKKKGSYSLSFLYRQTEGKINKPLQLNNKNQSAKFAIVSSLDFQSIKLFLGNLLNDGSSLITTTFSKRYHL